MAYCFGIPVYWYVCVCSTAVLWKKLTSTQSIIKPIAEGNSDWLRFSCWTIRKTTHTLTHSVVLGGNKWEKGICMPLMTSSLIRYTKLPVVERKKDAVYSMLMAYGRLWMWNFGRSIILRPTNAIPSNRHQRQKFFMNIIAAFSSVVGWKTFASHTFFSPHTHSDGPNLHVVEAIRDAQGNAKCAP